MGAGALLFLQVSVTNDIEGATRTCGSAFDAITDRSGWELWWARDLDEPDPSHRAALIRTDLCPPAINQQIVLAAVLGAFGLVSATAAWLGAVGERGVSRADRLTAGRVARLGRATSWSGAGLTILGAVAILLLVADADSTLFLYVDRFVVVIIGLIVLMPTMALFVIGRSLVLLDAYLPHHEIVADDA